MWSDTLMESLAECAYQTHVLQWVRVNTDHKGSTVFRMYSSVIIETFVCVCVCVLGDYTADCTSPFTIYSENLTAESIVSLAVQTYEVRTAAL